MKQDVNDKLNLLLEAKEAIDSLENKLKNQEDRHKEEINELENRLADKEINEIDSNRQLNRNIKPNKTKVRNTFEKSTIFSVNDRVSFYTIAQYFSQLKLISTIYSPPSPWFWRFSGSLRSLKKEKKTLRTNTSKQSQS